MWDKQPRSIGEILTEALALLRRHFRVFVVFALPFCAADVLVRAWAESVFAEARQSVGGKGSFSWESVSAAAAEFSLGALLLMAASVATVLLSAGATQLVRNSQLGGPVDLPTAFSAVRTHGLWLWLTNWLFVVAVGAVAFVAPAFLAVPLGVGVSLFAGSVVGVSVGAGLYTLAAMIIAVIFSLRWWLYKEAVVLENQKGLAAFSRSAALSAPRGLPFFESPRWRLSVLALAGLALTGSMQLLFLLPRALLALGSGWTQVFQNGLPPLFSMPLWFLVPFGLLETLTNSVVIGFGISLSTLFYLDLRVRFEGADVDPSTG